MKLTKFNSLPGDTPVDKLTRWSAGQQIYVQPKFHGISCRWDGRTGEMYTRQGKLWDLDRFPPDMQDELSQISPLYYGELVIPNVPFPTAAGLLSVASDAPIPNTVRLHVYDFHDPNSPLQSFSCRTIEIEQDLSGYTYLLPVITYIHAPIYADRRYDYLVEHGYEGCVYRLDPCLFDTAGTPHPQAVKRKKLHSAEWICVAVTEGLGKRRGMAGALILKNPTANTHVSVGGGVGITDEILTNYFRNPPINKPVTFTYEELSRNGVPLRPQLVGVRDYE